MPPATNDNNMSLDMPKTNAEATVEQQDPAPRAVPRGGVDPFRDPFGDQARETSSSIEPFAVPAGQKVSVHASRESPEPGILKLQATEPEHLNAAGLSKERSGGDKKEVRDPRLFQISCKETRIAAGVSPDRVGMEFSRAFDRIELVPELRHPDLGGTAEVRPFQASVPSINDALPHPSEGIVLQAAMFTEEATPGIGAAGDAIEDEPKPVAAQEGPPTAAAENAEQDPSLLEDKSDPFRDDDDSLDDLPGTLGDATDAANKANCDRIYNDENCCDSDAECRKMLKKLTSRSIRDISLDIAPPFDPLTDDPAESAKLKSKKLSEIPSRVFLDRDGNTLAEGKLTDFRENNVIIQAADGTETPIRLAQLGADDQCFVSAWWNLPVDCQVDLGKYELRDFTMLTFTWTASSLCHKPLYFEDVQLERYGHSFNPWVQPLMSGAHFYASLALLPYNMGLARPNECQYDLGYYRPGNCAPWLMSAFPWSRRAVLSQVGAVAGLHGILN
jgi:hypothetical protein